MLSRRSIRIKIMQLMYAKDRDQVLGLADLESQFQECIAQSFDTYIFTLYLYLEVIKHASKEAKTRHSKHLPDAKDRAFRPYLESNESIQSLFQNQALQLEFKKDRDWPEVDSDVIRRLYYQFAKTDDYITYATASAPTKEQNHAQLLALFKSCYANDAFTDILEYSYPNWIDDKSLVIGAMKKTIKAFPVEASFLDAHRPNEETTEEFGVELLKYVNKENEKLESFILPTLKNWDAERVAILDMILLKLALSELFIFTSIPTKVTLNEYVEISKLYSTEKSKDFINGILDRLMKDLLAQGKIKKTGRGLVE